MPGLADGDSDGTHDEKINFWTEDWKRVIMLFGIQSKQRLMWNKLMPPPADMDENSDH